MPPLQLTPEAERILLNYRWPGNIRQLKNMAEQISVIENNRIISPEIIHKYLPHAAESNLPVLVSDLKKNENAISERDLLYKVLFDMKKDIADLKKIIAELDRSGLVSGDFQQENPQLIKSLYKNMEDHQNEDIVRNPIDEKSQNRQDDLHQIIENYEEETSSIGEENLSIQHKERDLIVKALQRHNGRRKRAAQELGISERTLYRKIKEYDIRY